jgi:hypothetical protein
VKYAKARFDKQESIRFIAVQNAEALLGGIETRQGLGLGPGFYPPDADSACPYSKENVAASFTARKLVVKNRTEND